MKYRLECHDAQTPNIEAALKIIDPAAVLVESGPDFTIRLNLPDFMTTSVHIPELPDGRWEYCDTEIQDDRYNRADRVQRQKERVRLGVISLLSQYFHCQPPWGILSGVRPTKIFHYLRDKGFSVPEIKDKLIQVYGLVPLNAVLLSEIGHRQEKFFKPADYVSVYIGIPFCPTRCQYCSFAAVSLETHRHWVPGFLAALKGEIDALGRLVRELGLKLDTLYMGGGTPTSLDDASFAGVLQWIRTAFPEKPLSEFTVEAGRPETINPTKLKSMVEHDVTRISVNPQTMHEETLKLIGRNHTVGDIYEAVRLTRQFSNLMVNMDLILGLPGENQAVFAESLRNVLHLEPENITIHTLAPKRASAWRNRFESLDLAQTGDLQDSAGNTCQLLTGSGYLPYYLYRQRSILADLENVGYAKPGTESVYNIQMMEERQTILGAGAGAVTKWVAGPDHRVTRLQSAKCPATYAKDIQRFIVKKDQETRILLG